MEYKTSEVDLNDSEIIDFDELERNEDVLDNNLNKCKQKAVLLRKFTERRHRPSQKFRHSRIDLTRGSSMDNDNNDTDMCLTDEPPLNTRDKYATSPQNVQMRQKTSNFKNRTDSRFLTLCVVDNLSNELMQNSKNQIDNEMMLNRNDPNQDDRLNKSIELDSMSSLYQNGENRMTTLRPFSITQDQIQSELGKLKLVEKQNAKVISFNKPVGSSNMKTGTISISTAKTTPAPTTSFAFKTPSQFQPMFRPVNITTVQSQSHITPFKDEPKFHIKPFQLPLQTKTPIVQQQQQENLENVTPIIELRKIKTENNRVSSMLNPQPPLTTTTTTTSGTLTRTNILTDSNNNDTVSHNLPQWKLDLLKRKKFSNLISKLEDSVNETTATTTTPRPMPILMTNEILNHRESSLNPKPQLAPITPPSPPLPQPHTLTISIPPQNQIVKKIETFKPQPLIQLQPKTQSVQKLNSFDDQIPEWKKALIEKKKLKNFIA